VWAGNRRVSNPESHWEYTVKTKLTIVQSILALTAAMVLGSVPANAALLGLSAAEPTIGFGGAGVMDYNAATGLLTISAEPSLLFRSDPFLFAAINGSSVSINGQPPNDEKLISVQFKVDTQGNLVSGVAGAADFQVIGSIDIDGDDVVDFDGVLLQGEITQFGFLDGGAGGNDQFDLRFNTVSGLLASYFAGSDLAMTVIGTVSTEFASPFNGSFTSDFTGSAEGQLGITTPLQPPLCKLHLDAYCSVGSGPNMEKCRIKVGKSEKHWESEDRVCNGTPYKSYTYGMHGDPVPAWANRQPATSVKFSYVIKNTGSTPVSSLVVHDSFDSPVSGIPATLNPGQSVTLMRTESLREGLENKVIVSGMYQTAKCGDQDTVVIKDLLRDRRRHDYDDFRDKGTGDQQGYR
jgi:hypothetical protein